MFKSTDTTLRYGQTPVHVMEFPSVNMTTVRCMMYKDKILWSSCILKAVWSAVSSQKCLFLGHATSLLVRRRRQTAGCRQ